MDSVKKTRMASQQNCTRTLIINIGTNNFYRAVRLWSVNKLAIYQSANSLGPWVIDHMTSNCTNIVKTFPIPNLHIVKDQQSFTYFICGVLSRFFLHFVQTKYIPCINADFLYIWWEVAQHSCVSIPVKLQHKFSYVPRANLTNLQQPLRPLRLKRKTNCQTI